MEGFVQSLSGGKIKRYVQYLEISDDPELIAQYRKWHSEEFNWKEIRDGIRQVAMSGMVINSSTLTVQRAVSASSLLALTVTMAVPTPRPVIIPRVSTVTTFGSLVLHFRV